MADRSDSTPSAPSYSATRALEWPRFLALAEKQAMSEPGKALLRALESDETWARDIASARHRQAELQEAMQLQTRDALWSPLQELADPAAALDQLTRGGVLEVAALAMIRRWLYAVDSWSQVPRDEIRGELFKKALSSLPDPYQALRLLDHVLTPEGELSERASPKLGQLYSEIRSLKREISHVMDSLVKSLGQSGVLQESFSDVRDGRYVLPVRISAQGEIEGTIYEASASRHTVFIEPKEVSPLNNRLRQRQNDLIQEIYVVLTETSAKLKPFAGEIGAAVQILAHWDSVQAKARHGLHYGGKSIHVIEERSFYLRQTVHPLLYWSLPHDQITLNEIDFGAPARSLLITGPNTGGKTVLLKTLGLAAVCARTGFPFPATDQPRVPLFNSLFADLGDPQSIEAHLSSFSGHVLRYREILERMTDRSLVLIDELNTATDPEEGAALGRAVLETIMSRGALVVTTTHDPHLKALSLNDPRVLNASMEFSESTRAPTYRLVLGTPGRSRALETAERLGIPRDVLELARGYLSAEHKEFEGMLARLEQNLAEAAAARKEAVALKLEAEKLKKEWTDRTESAVNEMLDKARQKMKRVIEQTQDEMRSQLKAANETRLRSTASETARAGADKLRAAILEEAPEVAEALDLKHKLSQEAPPAEPAVLRAGMRVRIPKWKSIGTVIDVQGDKLKAQVGTMQMSLSTADVEPMDEHGAPVPKPPATKKFAQAEHVSAPPSQLDLRGMRLDDAMSALEQYLDHAYRSGAYVEVTIVHGLGTGAVREGTRKVLKGLPYIKTYRDGGAGHGGTGATLVEFDRD